MAAVAFIPAVVTSRTETQVAADTIILLTSQGFLDGQSMRAIAEAVGISEDALIRARGRLQSGINLRPRNRVEAYVDDTARRRVAAAPDFRPKNLDHPKVRPNWNDNGEKRCPLCKEFKPMSEYDRQNVAGRPKSACRPCNKEAQHERYLSVSRRRALTVGEFVLREVDVDVIGQECVCGRVFCAGESVVLAGALLHTECLPA